MLAQRFAYVCAGLFLLVLSYHVGAGQAESQGGGPAAGQFIINNPGGNSISGTDGSGRLFVMTFGSSFANPPQSLALPQTGAVLAVEALPYPGGGFDRANVLYADGNFYSYQGGAWTLRGNLFGGPPTATAGTS